uniref:NADH:quinone oxidoreductase/Mrp antiporter transmembrane domain-containing protein n=1 Tax=Candidatus Methanosuratincola petrocarbonis (ex Vanwonterghem et al. 2016) TaxID=1867261 RepID=A0A7J3UY40_9CREN
MTAAGESVLTIAVPILIVLGGIISPLVFRKGKALAASASLFFLVALALNSWLLIGVQEGAALYYPNTQGIIFNAASAFIVEITLALGFLGAIYSYRYFEDEKILPPFYALYSFFIATLVIMAVSFNILIIYVAFEASTIAGGVLILFTKRRSATKAAVRFFVLSVIGAVTILVGILYQNSLTGTFMLEQSAFSGVANGDLVLLSALYAIGFSIKVGIFPFGLLWLPAAHSEAPTPVSAILSGVMVQIAAFAASRIIGVISPASYELGLSLVALGALSVIVGAVLAAVEATSGSKYSRFHVSPVNIKGIKRIWAFSTSSEVGVFYILIGLALMAPALSPLFFAGILLHFLNHGLAKALLFFDSGFVIETSRTADLSLLKGLGGKVGVNGLTYLIGGFSLSLIPGTLGYNTFLEFTRGHISMEITAVILTAALFIFFTTLYSLRSIVAGKPRAKVEYIDKVHSHAILRIPGVLLAICIVALGIIVLLGANGIALEGYYHQFEEWFSVAAKTISEPWVGVA